MEQWTQYLFLHFCLSGELIMVYTETHLKKNESRLQSLEIVVVFL